VTVNGSAQLDEAAGSPDAQDAALLHQWYTVHSGLHRLAEVILADVEEREGVAPAEFRVLWLLVTAPGKAAPMNELSRALNFSTAGTTKLVDRMAGLGLVERRTHASDRRVTLTALTPAGAETAVRISRLLATALRRHVVEPIGNEGFATLVHTIGAIAPAVPRKWRGPEEC
jgi:DNA-binding MarR family transcriptional regulator